MCTKKVLYNVIVFSVFVSLFVFFLSGCGDSDDNPIIPTRYSLITGTLPIGGGDVLLDPNQANYAAGTLISLTAKPKDGFRFVNWTTTTAGVIFENANNAATSFTMPASMASVIANFQVIPTDSDTTKNDTTTAIIHTVTWITNGGTPVPTQISVVDSGSITAPAAMTKTGFTFDGWYTNAAFSGSAVTFPIMNVTANTMLYAKWISNDLNGALVAQPTATSGSYADRVLRSFKKDNRNWYVIDVGHISNSLIMRTNTHRNTGLGVDVTLTVTESVTSSISTNRTTTVSNSIVVTDGSTRTIGIEEAFARSVGAGVGKENVFNVSGNLEWTFTNSSEISTSIEVAIGRSKETSESFTTELSRTRENSTSITIPSSASIGYHRYAWYTINDVYFIISTSLDRQVLHSWDIVSCPRDGVLHGYPEFSPNGRFDNNPTGNLIVFSEDFWKTLPLPNEEILPATHTITLNANGGTVTPSSATAMIGQTLAELSLPTPTRANCTFLGWYSAIIGGTKYENTHIVTGNMTLFARWSRIVTETRSLTAAGSDTYSFSLPDNAISDATVEIYVLGAGGGGQGGHRYEQCTVLPDQLGGGAGGGGGAAAYSNIIITQPTTFVMTAGSGGGGGAGYNMRGVDINWIGWCSNRGERTSGNPGLVGGNSSVVWGSNTLIAAGGSGGGGTGGNRNGGNGGSVTGTNTASGSRGNNGSQTGNAGAGGSAGTIKVGSVNPFSASSETGRGGNGGYDHTGTGSRGGDGEVRIVITYHEIVDL